MKLWFANSSQQFIYNFRPFSDGENKAVSSAYYKLYSYLKNILTLFDLIS